jgi:thiamine phosphate synthase YjbQ (UPF0047 family)
MTVESNIVRLETKKEGEIQDITSRVQAIVERGSIKNGFVFLFVPGSTAALTTIEYDPGLLADPTKHAGESCAERRLLRA